MVIWILDCSSTYCTKVNLSEERQKELEEKFENDVEGFLSEYQEELGICTNYCNWMITDDDNFDEKNF